MTMKCSLCLKEVDVLLWADYPMPDDGSVTSGLVGVSLPFCPGCWGQDRGVKIEFHEFLHDHFELGL